MSESLSVRVGERVARALYLRQLSVDGSVVLTSENEGNNKKHQGRLAYIKTRPILQAFWKNL